MRIKDAIFKENLSKDDIKNIRSYYDSIVDSVFYCMEELEQYEKILTDKIIQLEKLKTQARLCDLYVTEIINYDNNKNSKQPGKTRKNITIQYLKRLSEMSQKIPTKPRKKPKI